MSIAGQRIKECRLANDLTQEDVAKHLGVGKQAVYKYETGAVTNIPLENLEKMAMLFHSTPCYLAGWDSDGFPAEILTNDEHILIDGYRALPQEGKEYMIKQITAAKALYGEKSDIFPSETKVI